MAAGGMSKESRARLLLAGLLIVLPLVLLTHLLGKAHTVEIHARMPEEGGFSLQNITVQAGQPLNLHLVSDDVLHGFAIGQSDQLPVDLYPGKAVNLTLTFDQPGTYTYYCTHWCGPNHWRMHGKITVKGELQTSLVPVAPLYLQLGIDIDAEHPAANFPSETPSAIRGVALNLDVPAQFFEQDYYRTHTPAEVWTDLKSQPFSQGVSDRQIWDLVAWIWASQTTPQARQQAQQIYIQNCAACHGATGRGDGVFANLSFQQSQEALGHQTVLPPDFSQTETMFGASPALLQGKMIRGGMGTGMPSWGLIFTEEQTWALVNYLWTFSFAP